MPICGVASQEGDVIECPETPSEIHDSLDCNAGCNNSLDNYQAIETGASIFGRSFMYSHGDGNVYRDTDWYHFSLTDTSFVDLTFVAEFTASLAIINVADCENPYVVNYIVTTNHCYPIEIVSESLLPGEYALFVAIDNYDTSQELKNYRFDFAIQERALCTFELQPGDIAEGEETCYDGYTDRYNDCIFGSAYSHIECGQTVIGASGVFWHAYGLDTVRFRDIDWYQFTIPVPRTLSMTVEASFHALIAICPGCVEEVDESLVYAHIPPCTSVTLNSPCVAQGDYFLVVCPSDWGPHPCGLTYRMTLSSGECTACDSLRQLGDLLEGEPSCYGNYVDHYNGGCESDPPAYGISLALNQPVGGTLGDWWIHNNDWVQMRDTDWYPLLYHAKSSR